MPCFTFLHSNPPIPKVVMKLLQLAKPFDVNITLSMINGVCMSQIRSINQTHFNHFRKLNEIVTHRHPDISHPDKELMKVVQNRKYNHERWRKFKQNRQVTELVRENAGYRSKIERIRMGKSIYRVQGNASAVQSVAHNFYHRKRLQSKIEEENTELAGRLIKRQSELSASKCSNDYEKMRSIMLRLEKFPVVERLSSFSHKRTKTQGESPKFSRLQTSQFSMPRKRVSQAQY